jgi:hypothetical protein
MQRRQSPTPINKQKPMSRQRSKAKRALAHSPGRRQCPAREGGIRPCSIGWRLAVITTGAPAIGMFTMVSPTGHHGQQSRESFNISGEERQFSSQLIEDQKSKVSDSAPHYLYHRGKLKLPFRTNAQDNAQHARRLGFFVIQTAQHRTRCERGSNPHVNNVDQPGVARQQGRQATTSRGVHGPCSSTK